MKIIHQLIGEATPRKSKKFTVGGEPLESFDWTASTLDDAFSEALSEVVLTIADENDITFEDEEEFRNLHDAVVQSFCRHISG